MRSYFDDAQRAVKSWHYNGFTPAQRNASNTIQRKARPSNEPEKCCITGFADHADPKGRGYLFLHLEDYDKPLEWLPCSKLTHKTLHDRFIEPDAWFQMVGRNYRHGAWFTFLLMAPNKMFRPYWESYPIGLPLSGELWPEVADAMELSAEFFLNAPTKDIIKRLWKWPTEIVFCGKVDTDHFMDKRPVQPVASALKRIRQVLPGQLGLPLGNPASA